MTDISLMVTSYGILERSGEWLNENIHAVMSEIDAEENRPVPNTRRINALYQGLSTLYARCSFERKEMDKFALKYGIRETTGAY